MSILARRFAFPIALLVFGLLAFMLSYQRMVPLPDISLRAEVYSGNAATVGRELRLIFIGSSRCGPSNHASMRPRSGLRDQRTRITRSCHRPGESRAVEPP